MPSERIRLHGGPCDGDILTTQASADATSVHILDIQGVAAFAYGLMALPGEIHWYVRRTAGSADYDYQDVEVPSES